MIDLQLRRRFYAEEVQAVCNLRSSAVVEALATVPREQFLPPGPWQIRGEGDLGGVPRMTPDASPRHLYHNLSIAIDPARQLYNGAPGVLGLAIDAIDLQPGDRVLHVGAGLGYYSAVMGQCVGTSGQVVAIEVDDALADRARANLREMPWVQLRHGDGSALEAGESFDAVLVNAGVTHPAPVWLACLSPRGRMMIPLTFSVDPAGTLGKGALVLLSKRAGEGTLDARVLTLTSIYSAIGLRDAILNDRLRDAFVKSWWPAVRQFRLDPHEPTPACWLHADTFCFSGSGR